MTPDMVKCRYGGTRKRGDNKKQALKVFDYYDKRGRGVYGISYFWVKLLNMIVAIKIKEEFVDKFFEVHRVRYAKDSFDGIIDASVDSS